MFAKQFVGAHTRRCRNDSAGFVRKLRPITEAIMLKRICKCDEMT